MADDRVRRADAQRNLDAVVEAAKAVFADSGVDAPIRAIAARAGVGVGTVYRHFPQRSALIVAVMRQEIDTLVVAARDLAAGREPLDALIEWLRLYTGFVGTKRGLAAALHSGDSAYAALPGYFEGNAGPALAALLAAAAAAGQIRADLEPLELIRALADLSRPEDPEHTRRMVGLLVDGMRFGAAR